MYIHVSKFDLHRHNIDIDTTKSILNNPSGPQSNAIKYKFVTWIWSLFCLQLSSLMVKSISPVYLKEKQDAENMLHVAGGPK